VLIPFRILRFRLGKIQLYWPVLVTVTMQIQE
jgi:hypothetical protein